MEDRKTYYDIASEELNKEINDYDKLIKDNKKKANTHIATAAISGVGAASLTYADIKIKKRIKEINNEIKELTEKKNKSDDDEKKIKDLNKALKKFKALSAAITVGIGATASAATQNIKDTKSYSDRVKKNTAWRDNYVKQKKNLDELEIRRIKQGVKNRRAKAAATNESVTLYEAFEYIDNYLNEKVHEVDGKRVHGTAARVALAKAKEENNSPKRLFAKNKKDIYANDANKLSKGVDIKKVDAYNKAVDDAGTYNDKLIDTVDKHGFTNKKLLGKNISNVAKSLVKFDKASRDYNDDAGKLHAIKRQYIDSDKPSHEKRLKGEYKRMADDVRTQGYGAMPTRVASSLHNELHKI